MLWAMTVKTRLSTRSIWALAAVVGATSAVAGTACGTAEQPPAETLQQWHGPIGFVIDATLEGTDVSDQQAVTLRRIHESVRMDSAKRAQIHDEVKAAAIDVLRIGDADTAQSHDAVMRGATVMERRILEINRAIEEVHATLDDRQRVAVAGVFRDRINQRFGHADAEVRRKNAFVRFTKYMAMTALQIAQLETLRDMLRDEAEHESVHPTREELLALVDAFEGDDFGEAVDAFHARKIRIMHKRFGVAWAHTNTVLSIFNDNQRVLLADLIDRGPMEVLFGEKTAPGLRDAAQR